MIYFFDSTLRDGSHSIKHQFSTEDIEDYCQRMDSAGMDCIVVGHGNGLGASSLHIGLSKLDDLEMLRTARKNLQQTKLATYMIPGFGTIKENLIPAIECGVDLFKIGCHCTEADTTKQHIEYLAERNIPVYGVLMMYHLASREQLLQQALLMESYGTRGIIIMDSAGASTPEMVTSTIDHLCDHLQVQVGFHAHNNLGLAVANTYLAIKHGATIVDATLRGYGAGAGNCQIEAIAALLEKENIHTKLDLYRIMDVSRDLVAKYPACTMGVDDISIINGIAGTFSAFKNHAILAAETFHVDARDILLEAGKRRAVAGQEDMLLEIAEELANKDNTRNDVSYYLSSLL
nr:4-hydroxy-2-oxovalerate aldolase [uncultured Sphaerochaeta sp.]